MRKIPYLDVIAPTDATIPKIPKTEVHKIRWKVKKVLEKAKIPKSNITRKERAAIKTLQ